MSHGMKVSTLVILLVGCSNGPNLEVVSGTVTLDGQPLQEAMVVFEPENGRSAIGRTDNTGRYVLQYTGRQSGAVPGEYLVSVTTFRPVDLDGGTPENPELIPARYNEKTILTATVGGDQSNFDFALESGGEMPGENQPQGKSTSND